MNLALLSFLIQLKKKIILDELLFLLKSLELEFAAGPGTDCAIERKKLVLVLYFCTKW